MTDIRCCARPDCPVRFEPRLPVQIYCTRGCKKKAYSRRSYTAGRKPSAGELPAVVYVRAALEGGPLAVPQLAEALGWSVQRVLYVLPALARWQYVLVARGLVSLGPGPARVAAPAVAAEERRCERPQCGALYLTRRATQKYCCVTCRERTDDDRAEAPAPAPLPAPTRAPLPAACPECGAKGALRRSGRDLYCTERCGYYATPKQQRAA